MLCGEGFTPNVLRSRLGSANVPALDGETAANARKSATALDLRMRQRQSRVADLAGADVNLGGRLLCYSEEGRLSANFGRPTLWVSTSAKTRPSLVQNSEFSFIHAHAIV